MQRPVRTFLFVLGSLVIAMGVIQYRQLRTPVLIPDDASAPVAIQYGLPEGSIPVIETPSYETVRRSDLYLNDAGYGVAVGRGSSVRFYPFQILVWHEVVHDTLGGVPILVSFDPLTYSTGIYERADTDTFALTGEKLNSNSLLTDAQTGSRWVQMTGEAIDGERAGEALTRIDSQVMSWTTYKTLYPSGSVLSRTTGFERDYTQNPYDAYESGHEIWFPLEREDPRLPAKSFVYGVVERGVAIAFPVDSLEEFDTIQSLVGDDVLLQPAYWFAWSAMHDTDVYSSN